MEHNNERNGERLFEESTLGGCSQDSTSKFALESCNGCEDDMSRFSQLLTPSTPGCEGYPKDDDETLPHNSNESRPKEIKDHNEYIQTLHNKIHHLEVHCYLYQQALLTVKKGVCVWQEIKDKESASANLTVICHHCGTERLLDRIAHLQQQVADLKKPREQ